MESYSTKSHIRCVVWRYLKTRSCHKGDITLKFCFYGHHLPSQHLEEDINQLWPTLLSIIESALRIQIPDALFSEILHNNTLGARDFSSAVSGFCQVFLVTRATVRTHDQGVFPGFLIVIVVERATLKKRLIVN